MSTENLLNNLIVPVEAGFVHLARKVRQGDEALAAKIGDLTALRTASKTNLVEAVNEVVAQRIEVDDEATGASLWSSAKVQAAITAAVNQATTDILGGADENNDTLAELAARVTQAMQLDQGILTTSTLQNFDTEAKARGRTNLGLGAIATKDTEINDSATAGTTTWSSTKIQAVLTIMMTTNKDFTAAIDQVFA